ncbi:MAG TPA: DUF4194 domain-containing protein [Archangium sp.]|uniref:DUF4194 domain-containing protein n=1 Tax=Archangium sp. TaxID=1872627 RepID=UPI002E3162FD|nr:DUF4194 domain-containing protein [Archangium sp.]HEX5744664.1 DUF4194 domain-containing protein [Archangium sp.]
MTLPTSNPTGSAPSLSHVLVSLMKGVLYQESDPSLWQELLQLQARVRDHVTVLGLQLMLDEAEGYAYLRQRPAVEGEPELPRLVPRRQLGYGVSLLLALLRKKLAEADATGGDSRLVLRRDDILEMVRLFLPDGTNQARLEDRLDADIAKVVELGFLRRMRGTDDALEVRRILKAFVDAQWLDTFQQRLADYHAHLVQEGGDRS